MSRVASARKTKVSVDLLQRMFQPATNDSLADSVSQHRYSSVVTQTMVSSVDLLFFDELMGPNASGKVHSAAHSRDRYELQLLQNERLLSVTYEESAQRQLLLDAEEEVRRAHHAHHRMLRHIAESNLRNGRPRLHTMMSANVSPVEAKSLAFPSLSPSNHHNNNDNLHQSTTSDTFSRFGPQPSMINFDGTGGLDGEEMDKLKTRVQELEHKLRANVKANLGAMTSSAGNRNMDIFSRNKSTGTAAAQALAAAHRLAVAVADEARARAWILDAAEKSREIITLHWTIDTLERRLAGARRVMLHAPFTSYRPKIPIEHSLAGEEYLRRWILVETLAHYEDCLTLVQQHENDARNALEDEYNAAVKYLKEGALFPHFVDHSTKLETQLAAQMAWAQEQKKHADVLHARLQLQVLREHESMIRENHERWEQEELQWLGKISLELAEVRTVYHTVRTLELQFRRQRDRHQAEVQCLVAQLPKDGILHTKFQWEKCLPVEDVRRAMSPTMPIGSPRAGSAAVRWTRGQTSASGTISPTSATSKETSRGEYWAGF